jgi:CheY-like chemotaxis protein
LLLDLAPDLWLIDADRGQISQVISNLVINAHQAMPTGGIIRIGTKNIKISNVPHVQITVQDEGIGIAPKYIDKIFDPYFTTKQKGSGLGLAITHSIVSKHNGRINVDSQLDQGTTFIISFPAAVETTDMITEKKLVAINSKPITSASILVLEDEETVRDVTAAMLERAGFEVSFAMEGQEAINKYRKFFERGTPFDVVITDLTIPGGMGGMEAAKKILRIDSNAKIIISSGYATDPAMANYKRYGFKGVVTKPYRFKTLHNIIHQILTK